MLINIPNHSDFIEAGKELLHVAFDYLFQASEIITWPRNVAHDSGMSHGSYSIATRRTVLQALTTAQQAVEILLKGMVVEVSPYLILKDPSSQMSAKSGIVDFDDLVTVDAKDLIKLIKVLCVKEIDQQLVELFNRHRLVRNKISHSPAKNLSVEIFDVYEYVCSIVQFFFEYDNWFEFRKDLHVSLSKEYNDSGFDSLDAEEISLFYHHMKGRKYQKWMGWDLSKMTDACDSCESGVNTILDGNACLVCGCFNVNDD
jgi:hypothetical protein